MYRKFFKRILDFLLALIGLIILSPVILIVMIALFITNRGKVFFIQKRPGQNAKIFHIVKFKTMTDQRDPKGELLPDADRLTPIGRWIRKTSLDEIPQLINVLKGDMSIVGPRPLLPEYLPLYNKHQLRRHEVRPGITGWAQVNGRNTLSWKDKFDHDVWYVDHCSAALDGKILLKTLKKVLVSEGINAQGEATMPKFNGEN